MCSVEDPDADCTKTGFSDSGLPVKLFEPERRSMCEALLLRGVEGYLPIDGVCGDARSPYCAVRNLE